MVVKNGRLMMRGGRRVMRNGRLVVRVGKLIVRGGRIVVKGTWYAGPAAAHDGCLSVNNQYPVFRWRDLHISQL